MLPNAAPGKGAKLLLIVLGYIWLCHFVPSGTTNGPIIAASQPYKGLLREVHFVFVLRKIVLLLRCRVGNESMGNIFPSFLFPFQQNV